MKKKTIGMSLMSGIAIGIMVSIIFINKKLEQKVKKINKFRDYYNMLNRWIMLRQEGKTLEEYFIDSSYKTIAIYGMGEMGNRLYDELKDSKIEVKYAVDENAESIYSDIKVISKEEEYVDVDVMVVTAIFAFDDIKEKLKNKVKFPIISLDDVVYQIHSIR